MLHQNAWCYGKLDYLTRGRSILRFPVGSCLKSSEHHPSPAEVNATLPLFWNQPRTALLGGDLCGSCTVTSRIICKLPMNHVCKRVWHGANLLARSGNTDPTLRSRGASAVPSSQCRGLISMQHVRDIWWMGSASLSHVFRDLQPGQNLPDDHSGEGIKNISVNITPPHPLKFI